MTFPPTHPALSRALTAREYTTPTAVQIAVLEAATGSGDLLVSAQTGSGKTVAFGLAMAKTLLGDAERFGPAAEPLALIIAPTRELALQVQRELAWLYAETGARVVTCVGGMDPRQETRDLNVGAHIVVGTPGRLRDHLERKRLNLAKLKTIVLDEADEMLDLGFREDLEFILNATPETRQTLLFSATMPRAIENLARRYQTQAVRIETASKTEQHADIEYQGLRVASGDAENAVVNVLRFHDARATLVFCATREGVKRMHARLLERGFSAVALSGELTQNERTHALQALRDGRARVLVATDVAARGLDLPDLTLVIHADLPNDSETLLHRSGRTGRAGRKGLCVLIVPHSRRRKVEVLLFGAKIRVRWGEAPTADEIRARDSERFLADPSFTEAPTEPERAFLATLTAARTPDEIALALVRMHHASLPAVADLSPNVGPPLRGDRHVPDRARPDRSERDRTRPDRERFQRPSDGHHLDNSTPIGEPSEYRPAMDAEPRSPRPGRKDSRPMVWFRLNIGRAQNADARWLLPLICRAGGVTKTEIGAIKIFERDTRFEILAEAADQFADVARTSKMKEGHISRVGANTPEDDAAVNNAIAAMPSAPRPKRAAGPDKHTSLPLAEREAAAAAKPRWKDKKAPKPDADFPRPEAAAERAGSDGDTHPTAVATPVAVAVAQAARVETPRAEPARHAPNAERPAHAARPARPDRDGKPAWKSKPPRDGGTDRSSGPVRNGKAPWKADAYKAGAPKDGAPAREGGHARFKPKKGGARSFADTPKFVPKKPRTANTAAE